MNRATGTDGGPQAWGVDATGHHRVPEITPMREHHLEEVLTLIDLAFGDPHVRRLVGLIRESGRTDPDLSLVALDHDRVIGHVMLSGVDFVTATTTRIATTGLDKKCTSLATRAPAA